MEAMFPQWPIIFVLGMVIGYNYDSISSALRKLVERKKSGRPDFMSASAEMLLEDASAGIIENFFLHGKDHLLSTYQCMGILEVLNDAAHYYSREMRCVVRLFGRADFLVVDYEFKAVGLGTFNICWSSKEHVCEGAELASMRAVFDPDGNTNLNVADLNSLPMD